MRNRIEEFKSVNQNYEGEIPLIIIGHTNKELENEHKERALELGHSLNRNNEFLCDLTETHNIEKVWFFIMKKIIENDDIRQKRNLLAMTTSD